MKIEIYSLDNKDKMPSFVLEYLEAEEVFLNDGNYEEGNALVVSEDNKIVFCEIDRMCPEDATFYRDLNWIVDALDKAYQMGYNKSLMDAYNASRDDIHLLE